MRIIPRFLFAFLACLGYTPLAHAIDFTPLQAETSEDGALFQRMYFTDQGMRIYFRAPPAWRTAGTPAAFTFSPPELNSSFIRLEAAPAKDAAIPLDEKGVESLRAIAQSLIPAQFAKPVEQWETVNPMTLQGWTSFEVGYSGQAKGLEFYRSVLFINLSPERQIRVIVEGPTAEFKNLYETAYRSLSSWWEVPNK